MRVLGALVALLLLPGCLGGGDADPAREPSPTPDPTPTGTAGDAGNVSAPQLVPENESRDFMVTFASAAPGSGTNAAQQNCLQLAETAVLNATVTLTWTADATSAQLELVARHFDTPSGQVRQTGASPLSVTFSFERTDSPVIVSIQSPGTGAVQQLPVHMALAYEHPAGHEPVVTERLCAF